jgi:rare lipoprotein A
VAVLLALACGCRCNSTRPARPPETPAVTVRPFQVGMASFYSQRFAGRRTASGERYDPAALTAAHRSLPLGTVLRVTHIDVRGQPLGPPVTVRVNDRGPYAAGRIIDLSMAAARRLGIVESGVVRVKIEIVRTVPAN